VLLWKKDRAAASGRRAPDPAGRQNQRPTGHPTRESLLATLEQAGFGADTDDFPRILKGVEARRQVTRAAGKAGPPAWLATARRKRWRSRLRQVAAWLATVLIVSAIVAVAAHFLLEGPQAPPSAVSE
jgi:hypothetical protein